MIFFVQKVPRILVKVMRIFFNVAGGGVGAGVDTGATTRGAGVEGSVGEWEN